MRMLKTLLAAVTFLLLVGPLSAHANIIYNWTGDCQRVTQGSPTSCTHASLQVITTDAYVPGTIFGWSPAELTHPTLLEFRYTDDNVTVDMALTWQPGGGDFFELPAGSAQSGFLLNQNQFFGSDAGPWHMSSELLDPNCNGDNNGANPFCGYGTAGVNGVWTRVPAPSTLVLLGVDLASLVACRRRKVR
jgi:hypothetical protein